MTEQEARALLFELDMNQAENGEEEYCEAIDVALKALEEIQQYRAIGTVEECREALEKHTPIKPIKYEPYAGKCKCGAKVFVDKGYCAICGQAIDWVRNNETHT